MGKQPKFYVVWRGRRTGVYDTWAQASAQVNGFPGAQYKAFDSRTAAERAFAGAYTDFVQPKPAFNAARWQQLRLLGVEPPILPSYSVDAACSGNPGVLEYRAVDTESGKSVFAEGPFPEGTNNIGEFLAIVELLAILKARRDAQPIYSDSRNALAWVQAKRAKSQLPRSAQNAELFERIARAEAWLDANTYPNPLLKWRTQEWGENPADYGRK